MPQTLQFYQPTTSAETISAGCGVPADIAQFSVDEHGSKLRVSVSHSRDERRFLEPGARPPYLSYQLLLTGATRVRISEPRFVLRSADGHMVGRYTFKSFDLYPDSSSADTGVRLTPASSELVGRSELKGNQFDQYIVSMALPASIPEQFEISYPDMVVNGSPVRGPVVKYESSEGLFIRRRCLF